MSDVVTGEAVALDLRVARLGSRSIAAFLDVCIQVGVLWFTGLVLSGNLTLDPTLARAVFLVYLLALFVGYPAGFETLLHGRTPGKMAMGLRVVRDDGGPIRFRHALGRALVGFVVERPGITLGSGAVICSLANSRGKRLGDLLAGTVVVQERVPTRAIPPVPMPPQLAGWAVTLDLSRMPDDLALAARDFLSRAGSLHPTSREQIGAQLVAAVSGLVTPAAPPGTPGWAYLSAVLAERRRRDQVRLQAQLPPQQAGWGTPPPAGAWGASPPQDWRPSAPYAGPSTVVPPGTPTGPAPTVGAPPPVPPPTEPVPAPTPVPPSDGFALPG